MVNSIYFVFSTYFWFGIYSVPTTSSDAVLCVTATLSIVGGITVFIVYGLLASDVEILIEKYMLKVVSAQSFTADELAIVHSLSHQKTPLDSSGTTDESPSPSTFSPLLSSDSRLNMASHIDEHIAKHLLLVRVLTLEDVSLVYYHVRMNLTVAFAVLLVLGTLFYEFYDDNKDLSLSLNYALSAVYRLGYSNDDDDSFSQMVSAALMLCGSMLFSVLGISIIREFSLKTKDIRYFHTLLDGVLCVLLAALTTAMFVETYDFTRIHSAAFAIDIMIGYGGSVPASEDLWSYWLLDAYTLAAVPLFAAYVSHVEVELDVGDFSGYMDNAISVYFTEEDLTLLALFEQRHNKTNAFGLYELHVLLILRLKEMSNMTQLLHSLNEEYHYALSHGMVPSVKTCTPAELELETGMGEESDCYPLLPEICRR